MTWWVERQGWGVVGAGYRAWGWHAVAMALGGAAAATTLLRLRAGEPGVGWRLRARREVARNGENGPYRY